MAIQQGKGGAGAPQSTGGSVSPQLPGQLPGNNVFGSLGGGLGASPTTPTPPPNGLGTAPQTPMTPPPNGLGNPPVPVTPPPNGLPTTPTTPAPTTPTTPPATGGFQVLNYDTSDPNSPFYDPYRPNGYEQGPGLAQIGSQMSPEMLANNPQLRALLEGFQQQQIAGNQARNERRYQRIYNMSQRNRIGEIGDPKQAAQNAAAMAEYNLTSAPQRHSQPGGAGYGYDSRVAAGGSPYQNTAIPAGAPPLPQPYTTPPPPAPAGGAPAMTPYQATQHGGYPVLEDGFLDQVNRVRSGGKATPYVRR